LTDSLNIIAFTVWQEIDKGYTVKSKELNCLLGFTVLRLKEKVKTVHSWQWLFAGICQCPIAPVYRHIHIRL